MAGTMLASLAATLTAHSSAPHIYWRIAFLTGIFTGMIGLYLRIKNIPQKQEQPLQVIRDRITKSNSITLLRVIAINGFSYMTYAIPFIFLNTFIPAINKTITLKEMLIYKTSWLIMDIVLIPIAGWVSSKFNIITWMSIAPSLLGITILPIFMYLPYANLLETNLARIWIIILGVLFVAPMNALLYQIQYSKTKYLTNGLGHAIGTELFGKSTTIVCFSLWNITNAIIVPAIYIASLCAITLLTLLTIPKQAYEPLSRND
jgi:hypothetical protein